MDTRRRTSPKAARNATVGWQCYGVLILGCARNLVRQIIGLLERVKKKIVENSPEIKNKKSALLK